MLEVRGQQRAREGEGVADDEAVVGPPHAMTASVDGSSTMRSVLATNGATPCASAVVMAPPPPPPLIIGTLLASRSRNTAACYMWQGEARAEMAIAETKGWGRRMILLDRRGTGERKQKLGERG